MELYSGLEAVEDLGGGIYSSASLKKMWGVLVFWVGVWVGFRDMPSGGFGVVLQILGSFELWGGGIVSI